ncbi:energy transducer TonB [Acidicapsa dinghuensis]|uniref:Energy transducer TonB n=1 Tax=Acidicapsa dinghuensis TaxID=2218256 RepID=A0ABW1EHZ1_9BACT|nr:energy transducer TonB [Acidicapsa dinghuensis]
MNYLRNGLVTLCALTLSVYGHSYQTAAPEIVYLDNSGITGPQLQPLTLQDTSGNDCHHSFDGHVVLSIVVDTSGNPRNIMLSEPAGNELDELAVRVAGMDRFTPAVHNGLPAAAERLLKLKLKACIATMNNAQGQPITVVRLKSIENQELKLAGHDSQNIALAPEHHITPSEEHTAPDNVPSLRKVGTGVRPPVLLRSAVAKYSDEARKDGVTGTSVISTIVDLNGFPKNIHVVRILGHGLDQQAIDAVKAYRFKPATTLDGEPVQVQVSIEVRFRLR